MIKKSYLYKKFYIEITNQCNLNCDFCHNTKRPLAMLLPRGFQYILNEIKPFGNNLYLHVKGEPLLHPKLKEFLDIAAANNCQVNLVTNGSLLDNYKSDFFNHPALKKISISLHSLDFNRLSETDYFKKIILLINHSKCYLELRIWDYNLLNQSSKLRKFVALIEEYFQINFLNENFKINSRISVSYERKFIWPTNSENNQLKYGRCLAYKLMLAVLVDGNVVPCCLDGEANLVLGNIFETKISQIILNSRYQKMIAGFKNNQIVEPLCQNCDYRLRFEKTPRNI